MSDLVSLYRFRVNTGNAPSLNDPRALTLKPETPRDWVQPWLGQPDCREAYALQRDSTESDSVTLYIWNSGPEGYLRYSLDSSPPHGWDRSSGFHPVNNRIAKIYTVTGPDRVPLYQLSRYDHDTTTWMQLVTTSSAECVSAADDYGWRAGEPVDFSSSSSSMTREKLGYVIPASLSAILKPGTSDQALNQKSAVIDGRSANQKLALGSYDRVEITLPDDEPRSQINEVILYEDDDGQPSGRSFHTYTLVDGALMELYESENHPVRIWQTGRRSVTLVETGGASFWFHVTFEDQTGTTWTLDPEILDTTGQQQGPPKWTDPG